jgi:hypothetical protein
MHHSRYEAGFIVTKKILVALALVAALGGAGYAASALTAQPMAACGTNDGC